MNQVTPDEWLDKADYEGGIYAGLEYGMTEDDIDASAYPEFHALVVEARAAFKALQAVIEKFPDTYEVDE